MSEDISSIFKIFEKSPTKPVIGPESVVLIKSHLAPDNKDGIPSNLEEFSRILEKLDYDVRVISCDKYLSINPRPFQLVRWFPKSILGCLKAPCSVIKLFSIASLIIFYKKTLNLTLVVVEELSFIIPILNKIGGLRIIFIEDVLKQLPVNNLTFNYRQRHRRHQLHYLQYVDKIIVSNKIVKRILEQPDLKIKTKPILLYPNIEAPKFSEMNYYPVNHILDLLDNESVIILTIGDYYPESNLQLAINAFRRILKKCRSIRHLYNNFFMIVCGNCRNKKEVNYMQKLMEANMYGDNLIFIRNMPFDFKLGLLKQAKCVLFPSTHYNHDQMLLMQCIRLGRIVIATKCDITDEFIEHDNNGYICRKPTPKHFEKFITKVLLEPDIHNTMGQVGSALFTDYYGESQYMFGVKKILGYYEDSYLHSSGPLSQELPTRERIYFMEEPSGESQEDSNDSGDIFEDTVETFDTTDLSELSLPFDDNSPQSATCPVARALSFSDDDSPNEDDFLRNVPKYQVSTPIETAVTSPVPTVSSKSELDLNLGEYFSEADLQEPSSDEEVEEQPENYLYKTYLICPQKDSSYNSSSPRPGCSREPDLEEEIDEYEDDSEYDDGDDERDSDEFEYSDSSSDYSSDDSSDTDTVVEYKDSDSNTVSEDYSPNQSYSMHSEPEDEIPDLPLDDLRHSDEEYTEYSFDDYNIDTKAGGDIELPKDSETSKQKLPRIFSWIRLPKQKPLSLKRNKSCPRNWKPLEKKKGKLIIPLS